MLVLATMLWGLGCGPKGDEQLTGAGQWNPGDTAVVCVGGYVAEVWYVDGDGDGYGDMFSGERACDQPEGTLENGEDCDDDDPRVGPHGRETCNLRDDDCNGVVDDAAEEDALYWYVDADGDHFGDPEISVRACEWPEGTVAPGDDCDDTDPTIGSERTWYPDRDGDGYGDRFTDPMDFIRSCSAPDSHADNNDDCDDGRGAVFPGADEVCNGRDDDCDGTEDEGC